MKGALLHGYIICDSDGLCQTHTLASNRADSWGRLLNLYGDTPKERRAAMKRYKRMGFRCARVRVKDAEVAL